MIGPIGARDSEDRVHADKLLKLIIKPTFSAHFKGFYVQRADHISQPGMIDSQVISHVIEADLVLADLTTHNANAFYELGIRHMLQKPVIHLFRRSETIPFDIKPYRAIEFSYGENLDIRDAKTALRKAVNEVLSADFQIENPVTRSRAFIRMQERLAKQRADLEEMAVATDAQIAHLQGRLEGLSSKTVTLSMKPGSFRSYLDDVLRSRALAEKLFEAIKSIAFRAMV